MSTIRTAFSRPLISQPLRSFPSLQHASRFIERLTERNRTDYRFNIQQVNAEKWVVSRVIAGGVA